jgi:hypothetical protein
MANETVLVDTLKWLNVGVGSLATVCGVVAFFRLPSNSSVPLRFNLWGNAIWRSSRAWTSLLYPATSLLFTTYPLVRLNWEDNIKYPFQFHPQMQSTQQRIAQIYFYTTSISVNTFFLVLLWKYFPSLVVNEKAKLPTLLISGFIGTLTLSTATYFGLAWKWRKPAEIDYVEE